MEKMNAIIFKKTGSIQNLEYTRIEKPVPLRGEVLVRVKACALNHLDLWILTGKVNPPNLSMPHILGCDISGIVEACGPGVEKIKTGMRVVVAPGIRGGRSEFYKRGIWDSLSPTYQIVGLQNNGGFAEFVKVPAENIIPVSKRMSFEGWAAIPLVYLTAWHMLVTHAKIKKNETVLIQAAGSGLGSAAIQIAKYFGAKVITTVGTNSKLIRARKLGANHVINYRKKDFVAEVKKLTNNNGVDVVFEHIGPETLSKSILCLRRHGRLVHCGVTSGNTAEFDLRYLYMNQISIQGSFMGGIKELRQVINLVEKGKLKPVIDKIFPLAQAKQALTRMAQRKNFGKIILVP